MFSFFSNPTGFHGELKTEKPGRFPNPDIRAHAPVLVSPPSTSTIYHYYRLSRVTRGHWSPLVSYPFPFTRKHRVKRISHGFGRERFRHESTRRAGRLETDVDRSSLAFIFSLKYPPLPRHEINVNHRRTGSSDESHVTFGRYCTFRVTRFFLSKY